MPATDTLTCLARSWLDGDRTAGPPLSDALAEGACSPVWVPFRGGCLVRRLELAGRILAEVKHTDIGWHWLILGQSVLDHGWSGDLAGACDAAEAALRRALTGGS